MRRFASVSRFAVVYTIKNEFELLEPALIYHKRLGAEKIYVFFDGTTDDSRLVTIKFPWVSARESVHPSELKEAPEWIQDISHGWSDNMDRRKRVNMFWATCEAISEGIDWIISVDVDELLVANINLAPQPGDINDLLDKVSPGIDQVFFENVEVVSEFGDGHPFLINKRFMKPLRLFWLMTKCLNFSRRFGYFGEIVPLVTDVIHDLKFAGNLPSRIRDPFTGANVPRGLYLGYWGQKSFVRVKSTSKLNFDVHKWLDVRGRANGIWRGAVLHYDLPNFRHYRNKFQQRPLANSYNATEARNLIARVARALPEEQSRVFFEEEICLGERLNFLSRAGIILEVDHVEEFFKKEFCLQSRR